MNQFLEKIWVTFEKTLVYLNRRHEKFEIITIEVNKIHILIIVSR